MCGDRPPPCRACCEGAIRERALPRRCGWLPLREAARAAGVTGMGGRPLPPAAVLLLSLTVLPLLPERWCGWCGEGGCRGCACAAMCSWPWRLGRVPPPPSPAAACSWPCRPGSVLAAEAAAGLAQRFGLGPSA